MPQTQIDTINPNNIQRLFLTALMLSHDFLYDEFYSTESWAVIASNLLPPADLSNLKNAMLHILDFNILVRRKEFGVVWSILLEIDARMAERKRRLDRQDSFCYKSPLNLCRTSLAENEIMFKHAGFLSTVLGPPSNQPGGRNAAELGEVAADVR